jgi:hypothetical protein
VLRATKLKKTSPNNKNKRIKSTNKERNKNSKILKNTNEQRSKNNRTKSKGAKTTYPKEVLMNNGGRAKKQVEKLRS